MSRIRIGVVGCGLIGQMMHLPHLKGAARALRGGRRSAMSRRGTLKYVGDYYGIARRHADHRELSRRRSTRSWC